MLPLFVVERRRRDDDRRSTAMAGWSEFDLLPVENEKSKMRGGVAPWFGFYMEGIDFELAVKRVKFHKRSFELRLQLNQCILYVLI